MPTLEQMSIQEIISRLKVLRAGINSAVYGDHDIMQLVQAIAESGRFNAVLAEALLRAVGGRQEEITIGDGGNRHSPV